MTQEKKDETDEEKLRRLCAERERLAAESGKPTRWEGPVNYKLGALILSYGRFEGTLVAREPAARTARISGHLFGAGVQGGYVTERKKKALVSKTAIEKRV